jgi:hypothetical protein
MWCGITIFLHISDSLGNADNAHIESNNYQIIRILKNSKNDINNKIV